MVDFHPKKVIDLGLALTLKIIEIQHQAFWILFDLGNQAKRRKSVRRATDRLTIL